MRQRRVLSKVDVLRVVKSIGSCVGDRLGAVEECWGMNKKYRERVKKNALPVFSMIGSKILKLCSFKRNGDLGQVMNVAKPVRVSSWLTLGEVVW